MTREVDVDNLDLDGALYLEDRPWLVADAKQLGVDDIEERIAEAKAKAADEDSKAKESGEYDNLNIKQLRDLAASRLLDKSGSKAELVQRLTEEDERLATARNVSKPISINEREGDSAIGESHPVPQG